MSLNAQVGIGTTSPEASSILEIDSNQKGVLLPRLTNTQMNTILSPAEGLIVYNKTTDSYWYFNASILPSGAWSEFGDNLGNHIATENLQMSGEWITHDGDDEGIFIRANGNVGVNESVPTSVLHVDVTGSSVKFDNPGSSPTGSAISVVSSIGNPVMRFQLGDGGGAVMQTWDVRVDDGTSDFVIRDVNASQDMFEIQSGTGRVDVGTSGDGSSMRSNMYSFYQNWNMTVNGSNNFTIEDNGATVFTIKRPSGDVDIGVFGDGSILRANSYQDYSDRNIKKNIKLIEDPLAKLQKINGYTYNFKATKDKRLHVGVIAQEVEKIIPSAVSTDENGVKSVAYNRIIPLLIEVAKLQEGRINALEKAIQDIKK